MEVSVAGVSMPSGPARRLQSEMVWIQSSCCFGGDLRREEEFRGDCLSTPATYVLRMHDIQRVVTDMEVEILNNFMLLNMLL